MPSEITVGAAALTLEDLVAVARDGATLTVAPGVADAMAASLAWVQEAVHGTSEGPTRPIYSINTGFGSLAGREAFQDPAMADELSRRLVVSNASGVGRPLDEEVVRAAMVIRAASLARGHSGARPVLVESIVRMLNAGVTPVVPEYGSLGASGDLIPLAHLGLVLTRPGGEDREAESGHASYDGEVLTGLQAMHRAGIERLVLGPKEGLALLNGTSFSTALSALAVHDAHLLALTSEVTAAVTIEALTGFGDAFHLSHAFKQAFGVAPRAYLQRLRKQPEAAPAKPMRDLHPANFDAQTENN